MKRLDELIKWYEDNASNKYEKMICEELKVINNMFDELEETCDYVAFIKEGHIINIVDMNIIRNRNLFYVCCSRPKKRLIIFVTIPTDNTFKDFMSNLVGKENIYTYSQYIDKCTEN